MENTRIRLVVECVLIVLSVVVGLAVNEWRQAAADRELAQRIVANIHVEMQRNLETLERQIARHETIVDAIGTVDNSDATATGFQLILKSLPDGGVFETTTLRRGAWDAAVSSGALRLLDYDLAAAASEVYLAQGDGFDAAVERMTGTLYAPSAFQEGTGKPILEGFWWGMTDLVGFERFLRDLYREHLPTVRAAVTAE